MGVHETSETDPQALLAQALREPFGDHVGTWFKVLVDRFPLWAFQARSFAQLHQSELPTTYPLRLMVQSILDDEGGVRVHGLLDPLPATLDSRRYAIAEGKLDSANWSPVEPHKAEFLPRVIADLWRVEPEVIPGFRPSPYEFLARQLVPLIEDHLFAFDKRQRKRGKRELDYFLEELAATLAPGRPKEGPHIGVLNTLVTQGRQLLQLCWGMFPIDVSDQTRRLLSECGALEAIQIDAACLAVPLLSRAEILALKTEADEAANWTRGEGSYPTSRRFVIWVLAHRLGARATALAGKALDSDDVRYFRRRQNPIDIHSP